LIFIKYKYLDPWFKHDVYILNTKFLAKALTDFLLFFLSGTLFAFFKFEKLKKRYFKIIAWCSLPLIVFLLFLNSLSNYFLFFLIPFILAIGLLGIGKLDFTQKIGDISYGIYLSSFFIQQFFISIYNFNILTLLWVSLISSVLYGFLSWNFIEKPCLLLKKRK
jgi:peptidoglycan/LPS O-acetylase OafA/YrhL